MFFYPITLSLSIRIFPVSRQPFFVPFRLQIRLILSIIMTHKNKEITMEKITSFTIDHIKLTPGLYVSRKDLAGDTPVTTFDIRITNPNEEPVLNTAEVHTIEHLAATFLRNHAEYGPKTLYFGPMGCRTGFYLLLIGDYESCDILPLMKEMFAFIASYDQEVPGACAKDCGNFLDMNLPMARFVARKYLTQVLNKITEEQLVYPQ